MSDKDWEEYQKIDKGRATNITKAVRVTLLSILLVVAYIVTTLLLK